MELGLSIEMEISGIALTDWYQDIGPRETSWGQEVSHGPMS